MRVIFTAYLFQSYQKQVKVQFACLMLFFFHTPALIAQTNTISGHVTSAEDGSSLPGVNVMVKETPIGTVTDASGNYQLSLPQNAETLIFSYISFTEVEVSIEGRSVIDVQMLSEVRQLTEVVVTAIGIEREKRALGYAISSLEGEEVAQKSEPDPVRALQGKVPGINIIGGGGAVGSGTNITIRGNSSLLGNNQPLFVVDGIPFDNTAYQTGGFANGATTSASRSYDIDPNNIASVTVLKGAAASALYGSRAANGVIVITTKSGRVGGRQKGMEVTYNGAYSMEEVANLPNYQTRYTQGNNFKYVDDNVATWGPPFDITTRPWQNPLNANLILGTDENWFPLVAHPYDRYPERFPELVGSTVPLRAYNTPKDFFRTGHVLENAISVSAGGEKANFTAGFSHMGNEGIVPENEVTRTSVNAGGNAQLNNGLFIHGSMHYVRNDMVSPPMAGLGTGATSVTERLLYTPPNINVAGYPIEDAEGNSAFYRPDDDNPYWLAQKAPHTSEVNRYFGKVSVGYDVFDWLNVTYQAGFNAYTDHRINVMPISTNAFPTGRIVQDDIAYQEIDGNLILTARKDLNESFALKVIAGHNANARTWDRQSYQGTGIIVRGIHDLDNTQSVIPNGGGYEQVRYQGVYADAGFSFRNYAFLNVSGRNDWHSGLPKGRRSFFYPAVSGALIFTDAFNISSDFLSLGKIRAGWASSGNDTEAYLTQTAFETNAGLRSVVAAFDFPFTNPALNSLVNTQFLSNTLGNNNLKPEQTKEFETGLLLQFFNNRVGIDFTYYNRNSTDQIVPIAASPSTGYQFTVANIGKVNNEGFELGLNLVPVQRGDFRWNIYSAFTRNRNTVEEIGSGLEQVFVGGYPGDTRITHIEGKPYGQIFGSVAAKAPDGQLLVDPATGKLFEKTTSEVIGDPNPDFILGVTNSFSWKGFTLSALLDWRKGGDMYSDTYDQVIGRGHTTETIPDGPSGREIALVIPGVQGDPATQQPILNDNGNTIPNSTQITVNDWFYLNTFASAGPDEFSVFDASTVRLRELSISYELPAIWLENSPFGSASISLTGRNLWYEAYKFPKGLNFDPETNSIGSGNMRNLGAASDGSGNAQGIDFGIVPTTKRYGVNLRLTF